MLPYWALFSVFVVGAFNYQLQRERAIQVSIFLVVVALLAAAMIGFRYEVGGDWYNYLVMYDVAGSLNFDELVRAGDPGYQLLNALGRALGAKIWLVNLACAVVFTWGLIRFSIRQPNPWLAIVVATPYLIIVVAMGYTRQAVAIALTMAALGSFEDRKYGRFAIIIFIAATFHKSAVITLPLIVLSTVQHRFAVYATAAVTAAFIGFAFLDVVLDRIFATYIESEMSSSGAAIRVAMNIIPAIIFLAFQSRFARSEQERLIWRNYSLAAIATLVALFIVPSTTIVDRIALYLIPIQLFVLSRLPYAFPASGRANHQLTLLVVFYSAVILYGWLSLGAYAKYWLPYRYYSISDLI